MEHGSAHASRWKELPGDSLSLVVCAAPYKRADVKLVCQAWRAAVNKNVKTVHMPAADISQLGQLPAVQCLYLTGTNADTKAEGVSSSSVNSWASVQRSSLQRLQVLHLDRCPATLQQLVEHQVQQAAVLSGSDDRRPGLDELQQLALSGMCCVTHTLPALLMLHPPDSEATQQQQQQQQQKAPGQQDSMSIGCTSSIRPVAVISSWPLQHLSSLVINACSFSRTASELAVLQQLPALNTLELAGCGLRQLPQAVCACGRLTSLKLRRNNLHQLPTEMSSLQALQVLDLSDNPHLHSLGAGFSSLTALTELNLYGPNKLWYKHTAAPQHNANGPELGPPLQDGAGGDIPDSVHDNDVVSHAEQLHLLHELAGCSALRKLTLANNRALRVLPASLASLPELQVLDARSCGLHFLNEELWECRAMQELLLGDNVLAALPADIGQLTKLQVLDIGRCRSLFSLPSVLLSLTHLTQLVLATKAVGQSVVERLELRSPNPVDVVFDADTDDDDDDHDFGGGSDEAPPGMVTGSEEEQESSEDDQGGSDDGVGVNHGEPGADALQLLVARLGVSL